MEFFKHFFYNDYLNDKKILDIVYTNDIPNIENKLSNMEMVNLGLVITPEFIDSLVIEHKNDAIIFLDKLGYFDDEENVPGGICDYFQIEENIRTLFHDNNFDLFRYVIEKRLYGYCHPQEYNRLLLYISEQDSEERYKYAKVLIDNGAQKELLKYHNKEFYEKLN